MATKYLDSNGLLYFWSKVKAAMPKKTSQLTNDSGFITISDVPEGASASTTTPKMDGTAAVGTEKAFARGDHVHPTDTSKANAADLTSHTGNTTVHITAAERTAWNNKVDKETGKGLSTNDYSNDEKSKLAGKADKATTLAGYGITDAYTKTEVDGKLTSALHYKGSKDTYAELPTSGNEVGDMWNIVTADASHSVKAGDNVAWNGTTWDVMAGYVDLSAYMLKTDIEAITNAEIDTIVAA